MHWTNTRALDETQRALDETRQGLHATQRDLSAERRRAEQAEADAIEQQRRADHNATRLDTLQRQYGLLQGSLHTFLRGYLPRLRRHLFGQRA